MPTSRAELLLHGPIASFNKSWLVVGEVPLTYFPAHRRLRRGKAGNGRSAMAPPVAPHYKPDSWGCNIVQVLRDAAPTGLNPDEIVLAIAQTGKKFGPRGKEMALASVGLRRRHVIHSSETLVYVTTAQTLAHGVGCYKYATRECRHMTLTPSRCLPGPARR